MGPEVFVPMMSVLLLIYVCIAQNFGIQWKPLVEVEYRAALCLTSYKFCHAIYTLVIFLYLAKKIIFRASV